MTQNCNLFSRYERSNLISLQYYFLQLAVLNSLVNDYTFLSKTRSHRRSMKSFKLFSLLQTMKLSLILFWDAPSLLGSWAWLLLPLKDYWPFLHVWFLLMLSKFHSNFQFTTFSFSVQICKFWTVCLGWKQIW